MQFRNVKFKLRRLYWKVYCATHDAFRRLTGRSPVECFECFDAGCCECTGHDFDADEGGYCLNDCGENRWERGL